MLHHLMLNQGTLGRRIHGRAQWTGTCSEQELLATTAVSRGLSAIAWMANKGAVTPGVSQKMEGKSHSASHPEINTIL